MEVDVDHSQDMYSVLGGIGLLQVGKVMATQRNFGLWNRRIRVVNCTSKTRVRLSRLTRAGIAAVGSVFCESASLCSLEVGIGIGIGGTLGGLSGELL